MYIPAEHKLNYYTVAKQAKSDVWETEEQARYAVSWYHSGLSRRERDNRTYDIMWSCADGGYEILVTLANSTRFLAVRPNR